MTYATPSAPALLPPLRQDLELLQGPVVRGVGGTWRVRDPARNRFFDIGPLEFAILSDWEAGIEARELAERVSASAGYAVTTEDVLPVLQFLLENQLLSPASDAVRNHLIDRYRRSQRSIGTRLLHNYLFFRIPLAHPQALLDWLVPRTRWIYTWRMLLVMIGLTLAGLHLLARQWSDFTGGLAFAFTWEGAALIAIAGIIGKVFHEIGHALTARRYGVRVPTIGVAFLVMFPMLYTDTSDSWRLADRRKRLAITAAGMGTEIAIAILATLAWGLTADGPLRTALFYLAFVTWAMALALNASPFMRFDGYFILSDLLDIPNLHERSSALARAAIRRRLFGLPEPDAEPLMDARMKRWLVAFALATWIYRAIIFLGIALIVYHAFFKLLGIFLMLVELIWFIALPVQSEIAVLFKRRAELRPRWIPLALVALSGLLLAWIFLGLTAFSAPALARARAEHIVQAPTAGLLVAVNASNGQLVRDGEALATLVSPEVGLRAITASIKRTALASELSRTAANEQSRERTASLEGEIATTMAITRLAESESNLMRLRAPADGRVRDLLPGAVPGRWVKSREALMRVVTDREMVIEAFIPESQLDAVDVDMTAVFYPENVNQPVVRGRIIAIDATATKRLSSPLMASVTGGPIATTKSASGEFIVQEGRYRILIAPDNPQQSLQPLRGTVRISGDWRSAITALPSRAISVLLRESGF